MSNLNMNNLPEIDKSLLTPAKREGKISDKKLETKALGYFADAFKRFRKNKSSMVAAIIIILLLLFSILVPFVSPYDVTFRDGYYKTCLPKCEAFAWAGWDGCGKQTESQAGYDYYSSIGYELDEPSVEKVYGSFIDENTGKPYYNLYVNSYKKVGFVYCDLSEDEYIALKDYQNQTGIQVIYPMPADYKMDYMSVSNGANLWYELADESATTSGESAHHDENGNPIFVPKYKMSEKENAAKYDSLKLSSDTGADGLWYCYAVKNQTGYKVRVLYSEYYNYKNGTYASFLFGSNQHGQDIFVCLAIGARLSFILAISVSIINFIIGIIYGSIEGYYGGLADLIMERVSDVLNSVPFIVVATLFQLHLAQKVGPLVSLLFAFVATGWLGIAYRVRTQFYRFKNQEYILAARTLGARDGRLIFRHILPNSLGTIITGTILIIPGVIFSESMLSYLGIISLETSGLTSIGTMLSNGQSCISTFPHIIAFPAAFIALLEISFNLFGNGLRDAFNPTLRGSEE